MGHSSGDADGGWRAAIALLRERERSQCRWSCGGLVRSTWAGSVSYRYLLFWGLPFNLVVTTVIANTATTGSKSTATYDPPKASTKEASF